MLRPEPLAIPFSVSIFNTSAGFPVAPTILLATIPSTPSCQSDFANKYTDGVSFISAIIWKASSVIFATKA